MSEEKTNNTQKEKKVKSTKITDKLILNSPALSEAMKSVSILNSSALSEAIKSTSIFNSSVLSEAIKSTSIFNSSVLSEAIKSASIFNSSALSEAMKSVSILNSSALSEAIKSASILNSSALSEAINSVFILNSSALSGAMKSVSILNSSALSEAINSVSISKELGFDNWAKINTQIYSVINKRTLFAQQIDSNILPTLKKYNWFISVSLDDEFISNLSQVIENSSGKLGITLRHEFINYFSEYNFTNLMTMVEGWEDNPLFKPRMKIFQDSVRLLKHANGRYNPTIFLIPTLISQIDGVLTDYLIQNEFTFEKNEKGRWVWKDKNLNIIYNLKNVYDKIFDPDVQDYSFTSSSISPVSLGIGSDFILNTLFQTAYTRQKLKKPFGLSRHKIMHGEYLKYGRNDHLYRSFLILDFLYGLKDVDYN